MCTVSWIHQDAGYQLLCNRDERHARKPALPPRLHDRDRVRFIAPIDGDRGGSWIGVNEFGLSLCLLNRYQDSDQSRRESVISRGHVLLELMDCRAREEVQKRILETDVSRFQPFTLVSLEPGKNALVLHWTGRECVSDGNGDRAMPLTSSSYDPAGVEESRKRCYERLTSGSANSAELLFKFHASHEHGSGPYSTCMHRADARTVSFCRIKVAGDEIEFCYYPDSPCLLWAESDRISGMVMSRMLP